MIESVLVDNLSQREQIKMLEEEILSKSKYSNETLKTTNIDEIDKEYINEKDKYKEQINTLINMGFNDTFRNKIALDN